MSASRPAEGTSKSQSSTTLPPSFLVSSEFGGAVAFYGPPPARVRPEQASSLSRRFRDQLSSSLAGRHGPATSLSMPPPVSGPTPSSSKRQNGLPSAIPASSFRSKEDGRKTASKLSSDRPETDASADPIQAAAMLKARQKLSVRDQEAMENARSTMMKYFSSSSSSNLIAPVPSESKTAIPSTLDQQPDSRPRSSKHTSMMDQDEPVAQQTTAAEEMTPRPGAGNSEQEHSLPSQPAEPIQAPPPSDADYVIAVVGHAGVGKSTVIRCALKAWGVSDPVISRHTGGYTVSSCFSQIQPGGKLKNTSKVEFLETDLNAINAQEDLTLTRSTLITVLSGAVVCYDSTQADSLLGIKETLDRLSTYGIPAVMLACKSDPDAARQVEASSGNSLGEPFNIGLIEVTSRTAEGKGKMRNGIRWLMHQLERQQEEEKQRKASLGIVISLSNTTSRQSDQSTVDLDRDDNLEERFDDPAVAEPLPLAAVTSTTGGTEATGEASPSTCWPEGKANSDSTGPSSSSSGRKSQETAALESLAMTKDLSADTSITTESTMYMSLEDLFDILFKAIILSMDDTVIYTFFLTYRRFCLPREIMAKYVEQYKAVKISANSNETAHWAIMRLTGSLVDWTSRFPGDLHGSEAQGLFREALTIVRQHAFIAHLTEDLIGIEQTLPNIVDVDASWSLASDTANSSGTGVPFSRSSRNQEELREGTQNPGMQAHGTALTRAITLSDHSLPNGNVATTLRPEMVALKGHGASAPDVRLLTLSNASSKSVLEMSETRSPWASASAYVLNTDPRLIAVEMTKLQWELFMAIRPRDVFRHDFGREPNTPVGRSIDFFNHLSRWVTTLILANPKPKHRAPIYEQFMLISHHLRRLNDYESLYAVISGMRETSVQRLSQTLQLVQPTAGIEKQFRNYVNLMDPSHAYRQYRIALQADLADEQAAIPLLTAILGMVNRLQAARPEDRRADGFVQWDKFAKFGEILAVITDCQAKVPMVSGEASSTFRHLLLDTPVIMEEDALFERSMMLEPPVGKSNGAMERGGGNVLRRLASLGF